MLKPTRPAELSCAQCSGTLTAGYTRTDAGNVCSACWRARYTLPGGPTQSAEAAIEAMRRLVGRAHDGEWIRPDLRQPGEDREEDGL